jgi:hypothetical protein
MIHPTLRIDRLVYRGPEKPPAEIMFQAGLNIICGSSETGKSFVVETIDFMLGSSSELRELPERSGYDRVIMNFSFGQDKDFTTQRSMQGAGYLWQAGYHDELDPQTAQTLRATHDSERSDNLSRQLLEQLGLVNHRLRRDRDSNTVSFSIRHLAHLSIVNETRIIDSLSPVLTRNRVQNPVDRAVFKFALTGVDDSALVAVHEARESHARLVSNRGALASLIESRQEKLPNETELAKSRDSLGNLEHRISQIGDDATGDERAHAEASTRSRVLDRFVQSSNRRTAEIGGLVQRFVLLDQHYESDLARLEAIAESGAVFGALHPGPCPFCGAPPEAQSHETTCDVDPIEIVSAARAEINRIERLRTGLVETKQRLLVERDLLSNRSDRALNERRQVEQRVQQLRSVLRERRRGIGDMDREAQQLRLVLKDADVLVELKSELSRIDGEIADVVERTDGAWGSALPPAETTAFAEDFEKILQAWDFPGAGRVAWEESRMDVTIGTRRRGDQGKGLRAITCSAFLLALMQWCITKSRPHLGLIVLDSPLLAYWKPEGQADDLRGTHVDERFYDWMEQLPPTSQTIVIENRPLPTSLSAIANVIHFTKNRAQGRYGLFPVE